ncbi:aspartyl protease family protein [Glycocaulis sp.]
MMKALCAVLCLILAGQLDAGPVSGSEAGDIDVIIASSDPQTYIQAIENGEFSGAQAELLRGKLAAMLNRGEEAESRLSDVLVDEAVPPHLRRAAGLTLAGVRLRAGAYGGSADAFDAASAADGEALEPLERQARDFAAALRDEPPMGREALVAASVSVRRDMAGLPRTRVRVNGRRQEMVLDTGAAFSTVTESTAERLGLRMLEAEITVGSSVDEAVASRLAVAERLDFGGVIFHNVVFIVLPDSALSFAGGVYRIPAILGLPVFAQLERLRMTPDGRRETLQFEPSPGSEQPPNMVLEGMRPVALVAAGEGEAPLRLLIDTGARSTLLHHSAEEVIAELFQTVSAAPTRYAGAGGVVRDEDALSLPVLPLMIAGQRVTLEDVRVVSRQQGRLHGLLGQDVLRARQGYLIDFIAMRLELLDD